ncbi:hypothetical protein EBT16_10695, partial [bacterium]|nr:hypothetical protein [bacterium]
EPFNRKGLECLAASAQAKGETSQALQLYQSLIDLDSTHRNNASYSLSILETLQKAGNPFSIMTQLQDSLELYLGQSTWKEIFSTDPIFMKQVSSQFELFTRDLAYESHSVAQKTKNAELYNQAQSLYGLFLKYFPDSTEAPKAEFYLAEICFKKNQFKEAAEKYESVYRRPAAPATKQQALEYAVLATGLDLDKNPDSEKTDSFLKLADTFTSQFPRDPKTPEFLYKASFLRYQRNEDKTAYGGFWRIVQQHPSHELAKKAAVSILDILNKQNDYPNLISACKRLREVPSFQGTALARDLGDVLRKAELKQISVSEKTEEYEKAGKAYLQYARSYGSEDLVLEEKAIFNAGVCFEKAKQTSESLKTREYFLKKFPTSSLRKETLLQVAKSYEAMAQPGQAARYFSLFQSENPSHGESPEALRLSGLYFWADSKFELAESSFLKAAHFYPQIRETVENDLLDLYTSENKWEKLFDFLNKARQRKGISFSYYLELTLQLADLQEQKFDKTATALWVEADKLVDKYRGIIQTSPKGPDLIGQVLLKRTTFKLNSLRSIRLQLPQANLEKKLAQKMRILNELEKDFAEIASLGG